MSLRINKNPQRIRNADFALESARLAQAQILQKAGAALPAQANVAPRTALSLLRN
jgi:flagellin